MRHLRSLKKLYAIDACIINGENSAEGNGITPESAQMLFDAGADVITTGNHVLKRREIYPLLEEEKGILRPANYHPSVPGSGMFVLDCLRWQLCVINLQGQMAMDNCANPFETVDRLLQKAGTKNILVDLHAEMTSEKKAMGYYLDGRVSAVIGTHTHVQTATNGCCQRGQPTSPMPVCAAAKTRCLGSSRKSSSKSLLIICLPALSMTRRKWN